MQEFDKLLSTPRATRIRNIAVSHGPYLNEMKINNQSSKKVRYMNFIIDIDNYEDEDKQYVLLISFKEILPEQKGGNRKRLPHRKRS